MNRLTPEREQEIREINEFTPIAGSLSPLLIRDELLEEIEALRGEIENLRLELRYGLDVETADLLAEVKAVKNKNEKLNDRIDKLREGLEQVKLHSIITPETQVQIAYARGTLLRDEKLR